MEGGKHPRNKILVKALSTDLYNFNHFLMLSLNGQDVSCICHESRELMTRRITMQTALPGVHVLKLHKFSDILTDIYQLTG